jgi:hypothetical protein
MGSHPLGVRILRNYPTGEKGQKFKIKSTLIKNL